MEFLLAILPYPVNGSDSQRGRRATCGAPHACSNARDRCQTASQTLIGARQLLQEPVPLPIGRIPHGPTHGIAALKQIGRNARSDESGGAGYANDRFLWGHGARTLSGEMASVRSMPRATLSACKRSRAHATSTGLIGTPAAGMADGYFHMSTCSNAAFLSLVAHAKAVPHYGAVGPEESGS